MQKQLLLWLAVFLLPILSHAQNQPLSYYKAPNLKTGFEETNPNLPASYDQALSRTGKGALRLREGRSQTLQFTVRKNAVFQAEVYAHYARQTKTVLSPLLPSINLENQTFSPEKSGLGTPNFLPAVVFGKAILDNLHLPKSTGSKCGSAVL